MGIQMKKLILAMTALIAITSTMSFAKEKPKSAQKEKTLIEQGLSLAALMKEKANSDAYIGMFFGASADSSLFAKIKELGAGDVSKPDAIYCLNEDFSTIVFQLMSGMIMMDNFMEDFSPSLKEEMTKKLLCSIPTIWTAKEGSTDGLAAVSVLSSLKTFDSDELESDCIYIFTFKDSYPVAVAFIRGEGRSVHAQSSFVLDKDFPMSLNTMLEEIGFDIRVEKIQ